MTVTNVVEKIKVRRLPVATVVQSKTKKTLFNITKLSFDKKDEPNFTKEIVQSIIIGFEPIKARDAKQAIEKADDVLLQYFQLAETKKDKKTDKPKTKIDKPKSTTKEVKKTPVVDKPKEKAEKALHTFKHYCENSVATCTPLTKENERVTNVAINQFILGNKLAFDTLSDTDFQTYLRTDNIRDTDSFLNRSKIRLMITESDSKKKVVQRLLLNPVYVSPYAIVCVVESHDRDTKKASMYDSDIDSTESILPCYETFQFVPTMDKLTTQSNAKSKNSVTYQFVNVNVTAKEDK